MNISLIGMSNIGKSNWSKKLAEHHHYDRIDCDDLIKQQLAAILAGSGITEVAAWMGQPFEPEYLENSRQYMNLERRVMKNAILRLKNPDTNVIIDTSGSVIYCGDAILEQLRRLSCVIYLEASPNHAKKLFQLYQRRPKPVIWGDQFSPRVDENPGDALARCYPGLLSSRDQSYRKMANIIIPYQMHRSSGFNEKTLILCACEHMRRQKKALAAPRVTLENCYPAC